MTGKSPSAARDDLPHCVEVFIAGIDGCGKSTLRGVLATRLERKYRVLVRRGDKYCLLHQGSTRELPDLKIVSRVDQFKKKREGSALKPLLLPLSFFSHWLQLRSIKRCADPDVIIHETDRVLHPLAYGALHFSFFGIIPRCYRVAIMSWLFAPSGAYCTYYLGVEPSAALERITKRGVPLQAHENLRDLALIKAEFAHLIPIAMRSGMDVVSIDTNCKSIACVRDEILGDVADRRARMLDRDPALSR